LGLLNLLMKQMSSFDGPWRVLIAEDHPITSRGLADLISADTGFQLAGIARDGEQALAECDRLAPALLLLDLMLPKRNGVAVSQQLTRQGSRPRIAVVSGLTSAPEFLRCRELGVEGLFSKQDHPDEILAGLHRIRSGERVISQRILSLLQPLIGGGDRHDANYHDPLTAREREVLALVAEGLSSREIGEQLDIAAKTAKKHRENIRIKLGVSNAVEAARVAARLGLFEV
jgi:DNA-binding NarL/FixJ family response regulator